MNTFVNALEDVRTTTTTENGGVTYSTSLNPVVDMFFGIGAKRGQPYAAIEKLVAPAFAVDPELAFRVALWARDVRQGAGERQTFRHVVKYMINNGFQEYVSRIAEASLVLGRADDLFVLLDNDVTAKYALLVIERELKAGNKLMAKWTPRKGKTSARIRNFMRMTAKQFRKMLVENTQVVETQMCEKKWDEITYSHVPSVAMTRYTKAFARHDNDRFVQFLNRVREGGVNPETGKVEKINTGAVYPYNVLAIDDPLTQDTMWQKLEDFVPQGLSFLPIIDTSGSMGTTVSGSTTAMDVAVSLGIYLAERNKGAFKDLWINFSTQPSIQKLVGATIGERVRNLDYENWSGSTNLEAAMKLIVNTASNNNVAKEDMPQFLLVLSDMEFNSWGNKAPGEQIRELFHNAGYDVPNIIWWNIDSRNGSTPVRSNEQGMALVSGFSPTIVQSLLGGNVTPLNIMLETIMKDRYSF